nr:hypothetical protein [Streptomyces roseoverticillatus]
MDRSSRPVARPNRTNEDIADLVKALRRRTKYGSARIAAEFERLHGITVAPATVHRFLVRRGLSCLRGLDPPAGEQLREVVRYEHDRVGDPVTSTSRSSVATSPVAAGGCTTAAPKPHGPPSAPVPAPGKSALQQVNPLGPGLELPGDRVDHLTVITPPTTPLRSPVRQQRLDPRPLRIRQRHTEPTLI